MGSGWDEYPRHSMVAQWCRRGGLAMNTHSNLRTVIIIITFFVARPLALGIDFLAKALHGIGVDSGRIRSDDGK